MKGFLGVLGLGLVYLAVLPILALYVWYKFGLTSAVTFFVVGYLVRAGINFISKGLIAGNMITRFERKRGYPIVHELELPSSIALINNIREGVVLIGIPILVYTVMF